VGFETHPIWAAAVVGDEGPQLPGPLPQLYRRGPWDAEVQHLGALRAAESTRPGDAHLQRGMTPGPFVDRLSQFLDAVAGVVCHEGQREVVGRRSAPAPRRALGGGAARFQETIDVGNDIGGRCHGDEATHPTILENASSRNPELVESKPSHTRAIE